MNDVVDRLSRDSSQNETEIDITSPPTPQPLIQSNQETVGPLNSPPSDVLAHIHAGGLTQPSNNESISPPDWESHDMWLQNYQHWFPILHRTSVSDAFCRRDVLHKAIVAITIWDIATMSWDWRQAQSYKLRQEVILEAMTGVNLRSIQSLLIISIHLWGKGKWPEYSSTTAICKR